MKRRDALLFLRLAAFGLASACLPVIAHAKDGEDDDSDDDDDEGSGGSDDHGGDDDNSGHGNADDRDDYDDQDGYPTDHIRRSVENEEILSLAEMLDRLRAYGQLTVIEARLLRRAVGPVYEFRLLDAEGRVRLGYFDARTGALVP